MELYPIFRGDYRFIEGEYSEEQQKINGNFNEAYGGRVPVWSSEFNPLVPGRGAGVGGRVRRSLRSRSAGRPPIAPNFGSAATGALAAIVDSGRRRSPRSAR